MTPLAAPIATTRWSELMSSRTSLCTSGFELWASAHGLD
jgi:hypothetical protein